MISFFKKESREEDSIKGSFCYMHGGQINIVEGTVIKKTGSLIEIDVKYPLLISLEGLGEFIKLLVDEYALSDLFTMVFPYLTIRVNINSRSEDIIKATLEINDKKYNIDISNKNE